MIWSPEKQRGNYLTKKTSYYTTNKKSIKLKKTLLLGATENPQRYAFMAFNDLVRYGHEVVPVSLRKGSLHNTEFLDLNEKPFVEDVDTVTLYVGVYNLTPWIPYILSLKPNRIIFNPGTENPDLIRQAREAGIETVIGCTLVMLRANSF